MTKDRDRLDEVGMLIERARRADELDKVLRGIQSAFGFDSAAYLGMNIPSHSGPGFCFHNTYSAQWRSHYHKQRFILIDPAVRVTLGAMLPQDWVTLHQRAQEGRRVFFDAQAFGLAKQGVSIPIRGAAGDVAVMSFSADMPRRQWLAFQRERMRDMQIVSDAFHKAVIARAVKTSISATTLSAHERDCLAWSAEGKSAWDISRIMGISESTVRFHLANVRGKLGCVTTTQAVARAAAYGLIPLRG